jgi:acyl-coenzyme A synthetase/AMP-(fatty) acid ligase
VKALIDETRAKTLIISPAYMHFLHSYNSNENVTSGVTGVFGDVPVLAGLEDYDIERDILLSGQADSNPKMNPSHETAGYEFDFDLKFPDGEDMPPDGIAVILHTSGTTSGKAKIVPITYQWQENVINDMVCS